MAISTSSKYFDIFYLCDKLFIQDPIIIMMCEYGCDHILLKKILSTCMNNWMPSKSLRLKLRINMGSKYK